MAAHFLSLLAVLLFCSFVLAQLVPKSPRRIPRQLLHNLLAEEQYRRLRREYESIQCDADSLPFNVSISYLKFQDDGHDEHSLERHIWKAPDATAQQICAKPIYGGFRSLHEQGIDSYTNYAVSVYGSCGQRLLRNGETTLLPHRLASSGRNVSPDPTEDDPPGIVFGVDDMQERELGRPYHPWNSRLKLYCRNHCRCNRRWDYQQQILVDVSTRPKGYSTSYNTYRRFDMTDVQTIELESAEYQWYPVSGPESDSERGALATAIYKWKIGIHGYKAEWVSLASKNGMKCSEGEVPRLFIADPYTSRDFSKILHLCAVALSGGNPGANAGGYCHHQGIFPEVHFSDEMTPRPEWRWANNFRFSAYIRHFCWQSCWCGDEPINRPRKMSKLWNILQDLDLVETRSGSLQLRKRSPVGGGAAVLVTPAQWKDASPSSSNDESCTVDDVNYCNAEPWPVDILGPPPPANPADPSGLYGADAFLNPALSTNISASDSTAMCGQSCDGPASVTCSGGQSSDCLCVVNSWKLAQIHGLDPILGPLALCINFAVAAAKLAADRERYGFSARLGGRDLEQSFLLDLSCPCNSTYVSQACCRSETGLVWEPEHLKLGELGENRELRGL